MATQTAINRQPVTAILPVGNEIHNIKEALESLDFADEIIVVDSFSTDGTYEVALEMADRVYQREYKHSADQKNWIIPQATHEWILLLDADERVTPALKDEILEVLKNPGENGKVGYWIVRQNHFMGEEVKFSGWRNDKVIRLFRKSHCRYNIKYVHERIIADGKVGRLKNKLNHYTYVSLDNHLHKSIHYATLQAIDYDSKTGLLTPYHFVLKPVVRFLKHYVVQGGFRDGVVGFTISSNMAYGVFLRYVKLWLHRKGRI